VNLHFLYGSIALYLQPPKPRGLSLSVYYICPEVIEGDRTFYQSWDLAVKILYNSIKGPGTYPVLAPTRITPRRLVVTAGH